MLLVALAAAPWGAAWPQDAPPASEVKERWLGRLAGRHFQARIRMAIDSAGQREERLLDVWRDDRGPSRERLMARFEAPPDLKDFGLLYLEHEDRPNDYFLYQPATKRVRRIPERLAREDVYGIDLEYLGFGVAQIERTEIEDVRSDPVEGRPAWRLVERATQPEPRFERRVVWLDAASFVPLRAEHEKDGRTTLIARTEGLREIQGVPTPQRVVFERPLERQTVWMEIEQVDYERPIPAAYFSTLELVK
jgi:hypothetical protein